MYTLIVTKLEHFTGGVTDKGEKTTTLLHNFKCLTLNHFRWYKVKFLVRVILLDDANNPHWKAKFIDGPPNLFGEKVRKTLRDKNNGIIHIKCTHMIV